MKEYQYGRPFMVICHNLTEYKRYKTLKIRQIQAKGQAVTEADFRFAFDNNAFRGFRDIAGAFYGHWRDRPDIKEIIQALSITNSDKLPQVVLDFYFSLV